MKRLIKISQIFLVPGTEQKVSITLWYFGYYISLSMCALNKGGEKRECYIKKVKGSLLQYKEQFLGTKKYYTINIILNKESPGDRVKSHKRVMDKTWTGWLNAEYDIWILDGKE